MNVRFLYVYMTYRTTQNNRVQSKVMLAAEIPLFFDWISKYDD